jgi:hypothetical protein
VARDRAAARRLFFCLIYRRCSIRQINASIAGMPSVRNRRIIGARPFSGGVEFVITGDWRAKAEYLYMDLNGFTCTGDAAGPFRSTRGPTFFGWAWIIAFGSTSGDCQGTARHFPGDESRRH